MFTSTLQKQFVSAIPFCFTLFLSFFLISYTAHAQVPGCISPAACNFDSAATEDDGSCDFGPWYIPVEVEGGPLIQSCSLPDGYILADQNCAQQLADIDVFCVETIFDEFCLGDYNFCLYGCTDPQWYIPTEPSNTDPAQLACLPPDGYILADQICVEQVIDNDSFCSNSQFDNICYASYNTCVAGCIPGELDIDGDGFCSDVDCNDDNDQVFPGAIEVCDGVDNNCDGLVDDEDPSVWATANWYADFDGDGVGDENTTIQACNPPDGYVAGFGDNCPNDPNKLDPGECGC